MGFLVLLVSLLAGRSVIKNGSDLKGYGLVGNGACAGDDKLVVSGLGFARMNVFSCVHQCEQIFGATECAGYTMIWKQQKKQFSCIIHGVRTPAIDQLCTSTSNCKLFPEEMNANLNTSGDVYPSAVIRGLWKRAVCYSKEHGQACLTEENLPCILPTTLEQRLWDHCYELSTGGSLCVAEAQVTQTTMRSTRKAKCKCVGLNESYPTPTSTTLTLVESDSDGTEDYSIFVYMLAAGVLALSLFICCYALFKIYSRQVECDSGKCDTLLIEKCDEDGDHTVQDLGVLLNDDAPSVQSVRSMATKKQESQSSSSGGKAMDSLLLWTESVATNNPLKMKDGNTGSSCSLSTNSKQSSKTSRNSRHSERTKITVGENTESVTQLHTIKESDLLGVGAFGSVYRALGDTGELFAVKRIRLVPGIDLEGAKNEYKLMSELAHPNIVKVRDFVSGPDTVRIIMEFLAGGSIVKLLNEFGALPRKAIILYTNQILNGLSHLHENGIVHSDIKPANILVHSTGDVKLTDFGLSRFAMQSTHHNLQKEAKLSFNKLQTTGISPSTSPLSFESTRVITTLGTGTLEGTIPYMSPNVVRYLHYTPQSDIWAVGCTVSEMLTGDAPWAACRHNEEDILLRIGEGQRPDEELQNSKRNEKNEKEGNLLTFLDCCFQAEDTKDTARVLLKHPFFEPIQPS
eukprot:TRINITY_DN17078_c2_g1_i1.p1 TRINITY_DN17078_c2_g1~~TRINITY_DN17078_c2_g1_i1.p1  ORF type:complete len:686 (+),score=154.26 TRINITY_DN17078_c2_g1_i1:70-2127(+)